MAGRTPATQQHLALLHEGNTTEQAGERVAIGLLALNAEGVERFGERIACAPLAFCSRTVGTCRLGLGKIDTMQQALGQLGPLLGLLAVIGGASRQSLANTDVVVMVGQHDDRDLATADGLAQVPDRSDAVGIGQGIIDHDGIGHHPLQQRDGLGQLIGHLDVDTPLAQPYRDHVLPGRIVLHQQYTQFAQCCFQHHDIPKSDFAGKMAVPSQTDPAWPWRSGCPGCCGEPSVCRERRLHGNGFRLCRPSTPPAGRHHDSRPET